MISATFQSADRADAAAIASLHAKSWQDAYRSILDPNFLLGQSKLIVSHFGPTDSPIQHRL
uniref:Protein of unassigned function n=1 Tax=Methylobacterium oryzae CBMB20 TaxID=693986 RepID=A0A088B3E2_9HYPH|nr:hypothetical protein [Methylobacterium oryzae]AGO88444.1 protein of unassigned function [Methylobacterium oryzae CBMB20]